MNEKCVSIIYDIFGADIQFIGALFGALHGDSWIPIELRGVQDYQVFEQLIVWLLEGKKFLMRNSNIVFLVVSK